MSALDQTLSAQSAKKFRLLLVASLLAFFSSVMSEQTGENISTEALTGSSQNMESGLVIDSEEVYARFSDQHIRMLNQKQALPEQYERVQVEIERMQVQHRRFSRRYGSDSVAARSARHRLSELINQSMSDQYQYAQFDRPVQEHRKNHHL